MSCLCKNQAGVSGWPDSDFDQIFTVYPSNRLIRHGKVRFSIRSNLTWFLANSKYDVKTTQNFIKLKYIVKIPNFEVIALDCQRVVWKTDFRASSGVDRRCRNHFRSFGKISYFMGIQAFQFRRFDTQKGSESRTLEERGIRKSLTQWLIIVLSLQMRHHFICFWVWGVDLWGYFFDLGSRSC